MSRLCVTQKQIIEISERYGVMSVCTTGGGESTVGDTVIIQGMKCLVVDDNFAETTEFVVCNTDYMPNHYSDDIHGHCADCDDPIHWRPDAPKNPDKICTHCAFVRLSRAEAI